MASTTSICNKALTKIGVDPIINIDTDTGRAATRCKAVYDDILKEVLREHDWNFAIIRKTLIAQTGNNPAFGPSYRIPLPTMPQFIRLISIQDNPEYYIENGFIVANQQTVNIKYIGKITDPNLYDPIFINALAARIASEIAFSLTSNSGEVNRMLDQYQLYLSEARSINFQEANPVPLLISSFNDSRKTSFDMTKNDFTPIDEE